MESGKDVKPIEAAAPHVHRSHSSRRHKSGNGEHKSPTPTPPPSPREPKSPHRTHSHTHTTLNRTASFEKPTTVALAEIEKFKPKLAQVVESAQQDMVNVAQFVEMTKDLQDCVQDFDAEHKFKIDGKVFGRRTELDKKIEAAEKDYAEKFERYSAEKIQRQRALDDLHGEIIKLQNEATINLLEHQARITFLRGNLLDQANQLDLAIRATTNCCFSIFHCCKPRDIEQEEARLDKLRADYRLLDPANPEVNPAAVARILRAHLEEERRQKEADLAKFLASEPKDESETLKAERARLESDETLAKKQFYNTVNTDVMFQLIRIHAYCARAEEKLSNAIAKAEMQQQSGKAAIYATLHSLIATFRETFDKLCQYLVCRPPANERQEIKYHYYNVRFNELPDATKQGMISGDIENAEADRVYKQLFLEHNKARVALPEMAVLKK